MKRLAINIVLRVNAFFPKTFKIWIPKMLLKPTNKSDEFYEFLLEFLPDEKRLYGGMRGLISKTLNCL